MTEPIDAHALLRTVLCGHPGCKDDAEAGRSTCRRHRTDRARTTIASRVEAAVDAGRLCKVDDCPRPPAHMRGPYAGLCDDHAAMKRAAHGARVAAGMGAAIGTRPATSDPATPLDVVKHLRTAARDLERAQRRHDEAKADLNRCRRAWKTALQDAAVGT